MNQKLTDLALSEICGVSDRLVTDHCKSHEDAMIVASALVETAMLVYLKIGGDNLAIEMLYRAADSLTPSSRE